MAETLTLARTLPAPPPAAFGAFVDPTTLQAWFWPPRFKTIAGVGLREGGSYFLRSRVVGIGVSGRYLRVSSPQYLEFDWTWDGAALKTNVRLEFEETGSTTRLRLTHGGFETGQERDEHLQGWNDCLDRLERYLIAD